MKNVHQNLEKETACYIYDEEEPVYYDCGYDPDNDLMILADDECYNHDNASKKPTAEENKEWEDFYENMRKGNFLRKLTFHSKISPSPKLNYPTTTVQVGEDICELYNIPINKIKETYSIIKSIKLENIPDEMYCFGTDKVFCINELKVIRYNETNYIVSPYFFMTGGSFL